MSVAAERISSFDHPALARPQWNRLLGNAPSDCVFLTRAWQTTWWKHFGRGELLLVMGRRDGQPVALATLFAESGMGFFVGSGGSDYLDFIGDSADPEVLTVMMASAIEAIPHFIGFRFHQLPGQSTTVASLQDAAARLGLELFDEGSLAAPCMDLAQAGREAAAKKSLVRHQRYFEREGSLEFVQYHEPDAIQARLDTFFEQHIGRWANTRHPSLFLDPVQCRFYRDLVSPGLEEGWLRFSEVRWKGQSIAFHFGFLYRGFYLWYKPSFDIGLAKHSPGEVLLRNLILSAMAEGAVCFDFGIGDEPFKARFATESRDVRTFGLYTPESLQQKPERVPGA